MKNSADKWVLVVFSISRVSQLSTTGLVFALIELSDLKLFIRKFNHVHNKTKETVSNKCQLGLFPSSIFF